MQYSKTVILAAAVSLVSASLTAELGAVSSQASVLSSLVSGFGLANGLAGALTIQNSYSLFADAVISLNRAGNAATIGDLTSESAQINAAFGQVVGLLDALSSRAADFTSVGAGTVVGGDIDNLGRPSAGFVSELISVGQMDCSALSSLAPGINSLSAAFSAAAAAYSLSDPSIPTVTCSGSAAAAGASGSAAASSSRASSAAASGSAASSAASSRGSSAAASTSKAASSSAAGSAATRVSSNAAVAPAFGAAAAIAGAAAYLL